MFSLDPSGTIADGRRDLYAHAFALFALGGLLKLDPGNAGYLHAVGVTTRFLDEHFADVQCGGYWDALPRPDALRRQNPHMHLLEAWLELFEATENPQSLERADDLVALATSHFIDTGSGALREFYRDDWSVHPSLGHGSVEPGHQMEWAWLLRRYQSLGGAIDDLPVAALIAAAVITGIDQTTGRVIDGTGEDGAANIHSSRSWPYCESIKALSLESAAATDDHGDLIDLLWDRLLRLYCRPELRGGWIDRLDQNDDPISTTMPASTLYHLMHALSEWKQAAPRPS